MSDYKAQEWMDPMAADGAMGSLILPEQRAKEMGFKLLPEKEAYEEMSKRLLAGWTMLNEHCPISGFPLLRKDGVTWSVRCNMEVRSAEDAPNATIAPAPKPASPQARSPVKPVASATDDPAPAPPILAERLRQRAVPEFDDGEVDLRTSSQEPKPTASSGPNGAVVSSSEITAQLSDLLLKGWRMLEEECPITGACPLMQQKSTGRKFSVAMQKFVDELGNHDEEQEVTTAAASASQQAPAPTVQAVQRDKQDDAEDEEDGSDDEDDAFLAQYREQRLAEMQAASSRSTKPSPSLSAASAAASRSSTANNPPSASFSEDVASVLDRAKASLIKQIATAEAKLNGSTGEVTVTDAIALAQLIGASATALRQVQPAGGLLL